MSSPSSLEGVARIPGTVWEKTGVELHIAGFTSPVVREKNPGSKFPARCPERHIQRDMTFCLGLHQLNVNSDVIAKQWWEQLRQYMFCQSTAERTGIWPPAHALDHGDAGIFHEKAIIAARELGVSEEYAKAYIGEPSWITDPKLHFFDAQGNPINGRAPCPIGCRYKNRQNRPVLRKDCNKRALILDLVTSERKRQERLKAYWEQARTDGEVCCGKMKICGLR